MATLEKIIRLFSLKWPKSPWIFFINYKCLPIRLGLGVQVQVEGVGEVFQVYEKPPPRMTLRYDYAQDPMVVLEELSCFL